MRFFEFGSMHMNLLAVALCMSGGFQQGFIASVLNQPYDFIGQFINETIEERFGAAPTKAELAFVWSALNSMFPVAVIFGQLAAAWMCRKMGRRLTGLLACALYIPGTVLCALSYTVRSFELLFIGRILWSFANGIQSVNATVWIVECAPPKIRGSIAALQELSMALGSLVCQATGMPFLTPSLWPFVFLPNVPFLIVAAVLFFVLPDSPHSIIDRLGDITQARAALYKFYGSATTPDVLEKEIGQLEKRLARAGGGSGGAGQPKQRAVRTVSQSEEENSLGIIFNPFGHRDERSRVIRRAAWLGVLVKIAYVATGARCLRSYTTFFLEHMANFSYNVATNSSLIIGILRLAATFVPVLLVDRVGRRPLINYSLMVTALSLLAMLIALSIGDSLKYVTLAGLTALLLVNSCGLGSVSRFYAAELVPKSILLSTTATLAGFEIGAKIASEFAWYPLADAFGAWSLLEFLIPTVLLMLYVWMRCPETSGRTINEVLNELARHRGFKVTFD